MTIQQQAKNKNMQAINNKQLTSDLIYMEMTVAWSKKSHCVSKQVGALVVKDSTIISDGYNGTPTGYDNCCEHYYLENTYGTKWEVIHAETNAIFKCAKNGISCNGATLYVTLSPCRDCSKLILQAGIIRVVYKENYKDASGIEFLISNGVGVNKL